MDTDTDTVLDRPRPFIRIRAGALALARRAADVALPPQCHACRNSRLTLCSMLVETSPDRTALPYCDRLGIPFVYDLGAGALSAEAIADPPPFDRCRAVAAFDEVARQLVHGLKYRDRLELAAWMAG